VTSGALRLHLCHDPHLLRRYDWLLSMRREDGVLCKWTSNASGVSSASRVYVNMKSHVLFLPGKRAAKSPLYMVVIFKILRILLL
jgi:hypothetical protein